MHSLQRHCDPRIRESAQQAGRSVGRIGMAAQCFDQQCIHEPG
jgi:hypothetical protein